MMREKFNVDLNVLKDKLIEIGNLSEVALSRSMDALLHKNVELAIQVIDDDTRVDILDEDINDFAILLVAKQQPVAIDLRRIIVSIKITTDIERIADLAVNIAKSSIRIGEQPFITSLAKLEEMYKITDEMLKLSIQAFNEEDIVLAKKLADMDDLVDQLYGQCIREFLSYSTDDQAVLSQVMQLSFVARYLERVADHVTNIAESIFYLVKGRHYDLNE